MAFFSKDAELAMGLVVAWRLDLARPSLGDGSRRRRAKIHELEELGRGPGRWANANGSFYCDSDQSQVAMELLQFIVVFVFFGGGGGEEVELLWIVKDLGTWM